MFTFGRAFLDAYQQERQLGETRTRFLEELAQRYRENQDKNRQWEKSFNEGIRQYNEMKKIQEGKLEEERRHQKIMENIAQGQLNQSIQTQKDLKAYRNDELNFRKEMEGKNAFWKSIITKYTLAKDGMTIDENGNVVPIEDLNSNINMSKLNYDFSEPFSLPEGEIKTYLKEQIGVPREIQTQSLDGAHIGGTLAMYAKNPPMENPEYYQKGKEIMDKVFTPIDELTENARKIYNKAQRKSLTRADIANASLLLALAQPYMRNTIMETQEIDGEEKLVPKPNTQGHLRFIRAAGALGISKDETYTKKWNEFQKYTALLTGLLASKR